MYFHVLGLAVVFKIQYVSVFYLFFVFEGNIFIDHGCIKLIKSAIKDIYNVTQVFYFK